METTEIRDMVHSLAHGIAHKCIERTNEVELSCGQMDDKFEVDSAVWHVHVHYDREEGVLRVQLHPEEMTGDLMTALGWRKPDDSYDYEIPVAWFA